MYPNPGYEPSRADSKLSKSDESISFTLRQFIYAFEIMKQNLNEWESSVDRVILANGNDLFIKNIEKVRRTFYNMDKPLSNDASIIIKGKKKSVHRKRLNLSMPLSKNHSPGVKCKSNVQHYPKASIRYDARNKNRLFSIPSDHESISDGRSFPPLGRGAGSERRSIVAEPHRKKTIYNRRSVRDSALVHSLEVDKLKASKQLHDSIDITAGDINALSFVDDQPESSKHARVTYRSKKILNKSAAKVKL